MLLRLHSWRRSLTFKKHCTDISARLKAAKEIPFVGNTKIIFSWLPDGFTNHPNAMSVLPGLIVVNAEWAARLTLLYDSDVENAFRLTVGHEMTHQAGDYIFWEAFTKDRRFVNWVSEVHADYGGAKLAFDGRVEEAVWAVRYKAKERKKDRDSQGHPSWKRREEYLRVNTFGRDLICRIAEDVGCQNKILIANVCDFYEEIALEGLK